MHSPLVSIIIPIYNVEQYLRECLDSVICQTYSNLSIVLVDDGSTDSSLEIAKEYFAKDSRIAIISKPNQGLSHTRNVGLDFVQGKFNSAFTNPPPPLKDYTFLYHSLPIKPSYIHFLDSDDYMELDCIKECIKVVRDNPEVDIVWHQYYFRYELDLEKSPKIMNSGFSTALPYNRAYPAKDIFLYRTGKTLSWVWCGLIAFHLFEDIRFIEGIEFEDVAFGTMIFVAAQNIYLLDKVLMSYRIRANSICQHTMHKKDFVPSYPPYMQDLVDAFETFQEAKRYSFYYSECMNILVLDAFAKEWVDDKELLQRIQSMLLYRSLKAVFVPKFNFVIDPRNCNALRLQIENLGYKPKASHIALYRFAKMLKISSCLSWMKTKIQHNVPFLFIFLKKIKHKLYSYLVKTC